MKLSLEIFIVAPESVESIRYSRRHLDITFDMRNPDDIVHETIKSEQPDLSALCGGHYIVHSTSWRYEFDNNIVLTYMVYSDLVKFENTQSSVLSLKYDKIACTADPSRPRPHNISEEHVVLHGLRHIGYLVTGPSLDEFKGFMSNESQAIFTAVDPALAGKIH